MCILECGGRGYGEKGNFYNDDSTEEFKNACEYLNIPYGFYFIDEATSYTEAQEEVDYIMNFLNNNSDMKMNKLPITIDVEYNDGNGRCDNIWDIRKDYIKYIQDGLKEKNISSICYCNAKRATKYLSSLDSKFWLSYYTEDGKIPKEWYTSNKDQKATKDMELMSKQIAWQFSETGAKNNGITENIDLSLVIDAEIQKFLENQ